METGPRDEIDLRLERAVLVSVLLPEDEAGLDADDPLGEIRALAETAGVRVVGSMLQRREHPDGRTYLGKGKVGELTAMVKELGAKVVIFDADLSPAQLRNVEKETCCKVLDRSEVILDIFANRAATSAARLQVEIAQLEYTAPRLRAMWSHLGQVTGGSPMGVGTRGPGEQQIEIDRRLVARRIVALQRELAEVQARKSREVETRCSEHFTAGLVGYTNAGKSSLFNALTAGGAFANDQLFATLHTRTESWNLGGGDCAMLSDTVGFIRRLPHHLVASFRATLEETVHAHLLLLVVDAADPRGPLQLATVRRVLDEIGATGQPRVVVLNKIDRLAETGAGSRRDPALAQARLAEWIAREPGAIAVSALTGEGLDTLASFARSQMLGELREVSVALPMSDSRGIDFLEKRAEVSDRAWEGDRAVLRARVARRHLLALLSRGSRPVVDGMPAHEAIHALWPPPPKPATRGLPPHERLVGDLT